jgi:outer membrane protein assembly factor BamB
LAGQKRWEFQTGGLVSSCPAIAPDGTVYVGSHDTKVYALDGATGEGRWTYQTGGEVVASPAVGRDGTVFVGSRDAKVYALEGVTGHKRWDFPSGGPVDNSVAIAADGTVFVGVQPDRVYALDAVTGLPRWEARTGRGVSSPSVGPEGNVYVGSRGPWTMTGAMCALNGATGDKLWEFLTGGSVESPVVGSDGTLYFSATELAFGPPPFYFSYAVLKVYALDRATGQVRWSARQENDSAAASPVISPDGKAYLGSTGDMATPGAVYAIDLISGEMNRWFHVGGLYHSSPAIAADGTIYVGSWKLYALAPSDARPIWEYEPTEVGGLAPPAIGADRTVYFGMGDKLYAFYGSSGLAAGPWPKFRADAQNTGRVRIESPLALTISWDQAKVRLVWSAPGVLQSSDAVAPANWQDLTEATSPYDVEPARAQRFYRLRRP